MELLTTLETSPYILQRPQTMTVKNRHHDGHSNENVTKTTAICMLGSFNVVG